MRRHLATISTDRSERTERIDSMNWTDRTDRKNMIDTNFTFQDTCVGQLSLFDGIVYFMFNNKAKN